MTVGKCFLSGKPSPLGRGLPACGFPSREVFPSCEAFAVEKCFHFVKCFTVKKQFPVGKHFLCEK